MTWKVSKPWLPVALIFTCLSSGCALGLVPLSAEPINAQVVDGGSGIPIEGAVVVAYWPLRPGSFAGDSPPCGAANVEEAVTDKDGNFQLVGWGPTYPACVGSMRGGSPLMYVIKPGYRFAQFSNGGDYTTIIANTWDQWKGQQMKLKKFAVIDLQ